VNVKEISRPNAVIERAELFESHNFIHFYKISAFFQQQKLQREMFDV